MSARKIVTRSARAKRPGGGPPTHPAVTWQRVEAGSSWGRARTGYQPGTEGACGSLVVAALVAAGSAGAQAQAVVWDNGLPIDPPGAWSLGLRVIADDFTVAGPAAMSVGGVRLWAIAVPAFPFAPTGTMSWQILDNGASGHPGNVLASGAAAPTVTPDGTLGAFDAYRVEFAIPTQVLGPGTYFLALHDGPPGVYAGTNFLWATSSGTGNAEDITTPAAPVSLGSELAFQLLAPVAVPEPATVALTAAGLAVLAVAGRRRRPT